MFSSLTLWNPEEWGKNPPKRWFERKGGKKERNENPINYTLFGYVLIYLFLIKVNYPDARELSMIQGSKLWIISAK